MGETPNQKIPVGILGATGSVGQRFVELLAHHPWFEIQALTASDRNTGKRYADAVDWVQVSNLPRRIGESTMRASTPPLDCPLVFSALDAAVAGPIEEAFARSGALVVSNARNHRMDPTVPLLVPEVNPDHLQLVGHQDFGDGGIITNPNCSTIGLVLALKPLADRFGLRSLHVVTMQALSGAGLPGVPSMNIVDNVIPYIGGEEEKMERESTKILGTLEGGVVKEADFTISAQCNRVGVTDGHTECVAVALGEKATHADIIDAWSGFTSEAYTLGLPSAPERPIRYLTDDSAPQPRLHRDYANGMGVSIGRLQPCGVFDYKFVVLSHNTIRGAAGGAILTAELAVARKLV